MKKIVVLGFGILLTLLLVSCVRGPLGPGQAAQAQPEGEAGEEFARIVNLVVEGSFTGDEAKMVEYLDRGAYGEDVQRLLAANDLEPCPENSKCLWFFRPLSYFDAEVGGVAVYEHGDVLLSRNIFSWTSNLLAWLVLSKYTHCGVFDREYFEQQMGADPFVDGRGVPCVLSATLNEEVSGVTYETWRDWREATTVTQMRARQQVDLDMAAIYGLYNEANTEYSFIRWAPEVGLIPVPAVPDDSVAWPPQEPHSWEWLPVFAPVAAVYNFDPQLWYCSKTTWWIYRTKDLNIENNLLIDAIDQAVGVERSGFYQLYAALFGDTNARAFCYFASDMCVWPDEIHASPELDKLHTWGLPIR